MSKNALPVTVMIGASVIFSLLPDRTWKGNFVRVQLKTTFRISHHSLLPGLQQQQSRLVASRICQRKVNVAVRFDLQIDNAPRKSAPFVFSRDALWSSRQMHCWPRPTENVWRCDGLYCVFICGRKRRIGLCWQPIFAVSVATEARWNKCDRPWFCRCRTPNESNCGNRESSRARHSSRLCQKVSGSKRPFFADYFGRQCLAQTPSW